MGNDKQAMIIVKNQQHNKEEAILNKLIDFFDEDVDAVIEFIKENNVPPHFITPGKRIDLHPAREYLMRLPRIMKEIQSYKEKMQGDSDDLDDFWG